mmetsp:Transcript_8635/g.20321  ORF Transcript_8635/g.20321 Transcript_8635/m.20321 type:complete len:287 (+) Transcript_8635:135-995(+)
MLPRQCRKQYLFAGPPYCKAELVGCSGMGTPRQNKNASPRSNRQRLGAAHCPVRLPHIASVSPSTALAGKNQYSVAMNTYSATRRYPFIQFERPSSKSVSTTSTLNVTTSVFISPKFRSNGLSMKEATIIENGTTSKATCVEEPTAMPMARPGRSAMANRTAPACSQALPATGRSMTPMKVFGMPALLTTQSITPTRISEFAAVTVVQVSMRSNAHHTEMLADSSSSSSSSFTVPSTSSPPCRSSSCVSVCVCVRSWNTKKAAYVDMTIQAPILETMMTFWWSGVK